MHGIFFLRVSRSFVPVFLSVFFLVACSSGSDTAGTVDTGVTSGTVTSDGLLAGIPTASTLETIVDYYDDTDTGPAPIENDANGIPVVRDKLELFLSADATVEELNQLLQSIDARLVSMLGSSNAVIIQFPDPGSLTALQAIIDQLEASTIIDKVNRAEKTFQLTALPKSYSSADPTVTAQMEPIDHQLAVRLHAAWNARAAIEYDSSDKPIFLIFDGFGAGAPGPDNASQLTALNSFSHPVSDVHGYHVLGTAMSTFNGGNDARGQVAGVFPATSVSTIVYDVADPATGSDPEFLHRIVQAAKSTSKRIVLNTSIGFNCSPDEGAPAGDPTNAQKFCIESYATEQAHDWIKRIRGLPDYLTGSIDSDSLEHRMLHVAAAGNRDGVFGYDVAKHGSWWNAAALIPNLEVPLLGIDIPNTTNTLVVENRLNTPPTAINPAEPACLNKGSFKGGNISAIGTMVYSFSGPNASGYGDEADGTCGPSSTAVGACHLTGTSMASPQVAGLATYIWTLKPDLSVQEVIDILKSSAKDDSLSITDPNDPNFIDTIQSDCDTADEPAPVIDAYAAILRVDDPTSLDEGGDPLKAPARIAILDVINTDNAKTFKYEDLELLLNGGTTETPLEPLSETDTGTLDYGRHDLNGNAFTGGANKEWFDLDMDGAYGTVSYTFNGQSATLNEKELTDFQILCYYAYSNLYKGDPAHRDTLMAPFAEQCGVSAVRIGFISTRDGNNEIYIMNSDGSDQTNVTNSPDDEPWIFIYNTAPQDFQWSQDGSKLAYNKRTNSGTFLYIADGDGQNEKQITNDFNTYAPAWSPNGDYLLYYKDTYGSLDIFKFEINTGIEENLTKGFENYYASWSPTGEKIVFNGIRNTDNNQNVYMMNADGSGINRITDDSEDMGHPIWSPDGKKIAYFRVDGLGSVFDIYIYDTQSGISTQLTNGAENEVDLAWSPDSSKLAFASDKGGSSAWVIHVIDINSPGMGNQLTSGGNDVNPLWSPDGNKIIFARLTDRNIYSIDIDGTNLVNLTKTSSAGVNTEPVWVK